MGRSWEGSRAVNSPLLTIQDNSKLYKIFTSSRGCKAIRSGDVRTRECVGGAERGRRRWAGWIVEDNKHSSNDNDKPKPPCKHIHIFRASSSFAPTSPWHGFDALGTCLQHLRDRPNPVSAYRKQEDSLPVVEA